MVNGIVNAFDHLGFCLVLNLITTCSDGSWLLYGHQILLRSMLVLLLTSKLGLLLTSKLGTAKMLISNTNKAFI